MTYLELINKVLVGLREDTVLGIADHYSKLIGQFVNEAKEEIEDMGPWFALRTTLTGNTAAGTQTLDLTASTNERSYILDNPVDNGSGVWITTSGSENRLVRKSWEDLENLYNRDADQDNQDPEYYAVRTTNSGLILRFWPCPDAVYAISARAVVPQAELTTSTTTLTIAAAPVWKLALAKAMDERGSEFAGKVETSAAKAEAAIRDYKLRDFLTEPYTVNAV